MSFTEFLTLWRAGQLDKDAAWRAYDITKAYRPRHTRLALKALTMSYAGDHAVGEAMARYGLDDPEVTRRMLGAWWLLNQINSERVMRAPLRIAK